MGKDILTRKNCLIEIRNNQLGQLVATQINLRMSQRQQIVKAGSQQVQAEVVNYQNKIKNLKEMIVIIDEMIAQEEKGVAQS